MIELIAKLLTGLGLYFSGVGGIRANLQQLPGRKFRDFVAKATGSPLSAAWSGFAMGTVTQTSIGVTVILAGLISRGMATVRQALPIVAWSNLGLVTLVFLNNLPVHVLAMTLIGLCGICINFGFGGRFKGLMAPFFSLGLVLFGLRLMKESMHGLTSIPALASTFSHLPFSTLSAFLLGVVLRVPIQSSSAVALIGITLHSAGIFTENQAMMMLYGTALGSGVSVFILTAHFRGVMRQITLFEGIINALAGVVMLLLFYAERLSETPLLLARVQSLTANVDLRLAYCFLVQQALCVGFAYLLLPRASTFLEKLAPTTVEQDLSRPRFIHDQAVQDPGTALALVEQELNGLLKRTPSYLQALREEKPAASTSPSATPAIQHAAAKSILTETEHFLAELSSRLGNTPEFSLSLLHMERRLHLLEEIESSVFHITQNLACLPTTVGGDPLQSFKHNVVESLDMLLTTAVEASQGEPDEVDMLRRLTASPGEVIEQLRTRYLSDTTALNHVQRAGILAITTQHERAMLTLQQMSRALTPAAIS